jgi:hypothetical protein
MNRSILLLYYLNIIYYYYYYYYIIYNPHIPAYHDHPGSDIHRPRHPD